MTQAGRSVTGSNSANPDSKNQAKTFTFSHKITIMQLDNLGAMFYLPPAFQRAHASRAQAAIKSQ